MNKKVLHNIITALLVLLILSTSFMIYFSNLKAVTFDKELYETKYREFDIYSRFSEDTDLEAETGILLEYLEHGEGEIETDFFNEKEKTHLVEVRHLFKIANIALNTAVIISIISLFLLLIAIRYFSAYLKQPPEYLKKILSNLLIGIGIVVDGIALVFALIALTFSSSFIKFHELFFKTDTWLLDPATDNLIRMFPQQFFFDMFVRIIMLSVIFATILLIIGIAIRLIKPEMVSRYLKK